MCAWGAKKTSVINLVDVARRSPEEDLGSCIWFVLAKILCLDFYFRFCHHASTIKRCGLCGSEW